MQDLKTMDNIARVEFAGLENDGLNFGGLEFGGEENAVLHQYGLTLAASNIFC